MFVAPESTTEHAAGQGFPPSLVAPAVLARMLDDGRPAFPGTNRDGL